MLHEHSTNDDGIDHGSESLMKISARLLVKAFSNKLTFILRNRAIEILFDTKIPFVAYCFLPQARGNERPSSFLDECIILILHGLNPLRILESLGDTAGFRDRWKEGGESISLVGFDDGTFRSGLYGTVV